jgi:arylsulfatase A-like enzyme
MLFVRGRKLNSERASVIDVAPTVLELMEIERPSDFDGRSLLA